MRVMSATAALSIAGLAMIVALAWHSWDGMNPAAGAVATLADAALHGEAPGATQADRVLATVYLPPFPLLVAAAHASGLSWRNALRACSVLAALALLIAVAVAARAAGGDGRAIATAWALLAASFPLHAAAVSGRADLLAAALSVMALAAWLRDPEASGWTTPLWCALAAATRASAWAVPIALLTWLAIGGEWRRALAFGVRMLLAGAALLLVLQPWHAAAWTLDVWRTLLTPRHTLLALRAPAELLRYLASFAELAACAALAGVAWMSAPRPPAALRSALLVALAIATIALADRQSDHNHLIEPLAMACVAAGLIVRTDVRPARRLAIALVALTCTAATWRDLDATRRSTASPDAQRRVVLDSLAHAQGERLTEDPLLALAAGARPAVADAAVLRSLALRGDPRAARVLADLARDRWAMIVLNEDAAKRRDGWYRDFHFGQAFVDTLLRRDVRTGTADGYVLYRPARGR